MSQGRSSSGTGRRNRGHHYNHKNKINVGDKGREILESIDENSLVIKQFRGYAAELDAKHDRYERIVKLSRDIAIESKRIIFLLHTIDKESKRPAVLVEAKTRIDNAASTLFALIAHELEGQDAYQYHRAYRAGLQEYVEAVTFCQFMNNNTLQDWKYLEGSLTFDAKHKSKDDEENKDPCTKKIQTPIPPSEYILGIADLTGELMRKCINNLASGDINSCYQTCNFVRNMYKGFLGCVGVSGKEVSRKLYTLKQSLTKMENVCYTIKVRGSEIPKHMLANVAIAASEEYNGEDDEGYQVY